MSRVYIASQRKSIPSERVDPWKHEDRPSPGCEGLLSIRTLRCWDHDRISISRPNGFLGSHRERNQHKRDFLYFRAIQGHSGGTLVDPTLQDNVLLPRDVGSARDMHSIIQGGLIPGGKSQKGKVYGYFAMASWSLDNFPGKRRRTEEKVSVLLWTLILPTISCISEQPRDIQEVLSLIQHCKTMYCYRETSGALATCTPSSRADWFQEESLKRARFMGTSQWPVEAWITFLAKGGGPKKRFQYCFEP